MSTAVEIVDVSKSFGPHVAVDNLSLKVPAGTIYGFIGPNGSGKTTTLRMIMRILHPDTGHIKVLEQEKWESANDRISYLPEERGLYKTMKVKDTLQFFANLKGKGDASADIDMWLEKMGLSDWAKKPIQALSKGMAQKVQFIASVISKPELVLLDEPFSGLDPVNAVGLKDAVLELKRNGTTVIFSTHDMSVAEKMCDAIFMIFKGKKVLDGTLESIQNAYGEDTIRVQTNYAGLNQIQGIKSVSDFGKWQEIRMNTNANPQSILRELHNKAEVRHFEIAKPSLQDIFMRIVGQENVPTEQVGA